MANDGAPVKMTLSIYLIVYKWFSARLRTVANRFATEEAGFELRVPL